MKALSGVDVPNPRPEDFGLLGWSSDPVYTTSGVILTAGRAKVVWVPVKSRAVISKVLVAVSTGGATLTVSGLAIYSAAGNLLSNASPSATAFQSAVVVSGNVTTPQAPAIADKGVYVAVWAVGTTQPTISRNGTNFVGVNMVGSAKSGFIRCGQTGASTFTTGTPPGTLGALAADNAIIACVE